MSLAPKNDDSASDFILDKPWNMFSPTIHKLKVLIG